MAGVEVLKSLQQYLEHGYVMTWKRFINHWKFAGGIHRSPLDFPHKGPVIRSFHDFIIIGLRNIEQTVEVR